MDTAIREGYWLLAFYRFGSDFHRRVFPLNSSGGLSGGVPEFLRSVYHFSRDVEAEIILSRQDFDLTKAMFAANAGLLTIHRGLQTPTLPDLGFSATRRPLPSGEGVEAGKSGKKSPAMCPADKERIRRTLGLPPVLSRSLNYYPLPLLFLYAMPAPLKTLLLSFCSVSLLLYFFTMAL